MKFSYAMLPDYPLSESLASIKKADELGFYAVYAADETWHKDLWLLFAAAAAQTTQIRMGPSVSGVVLREPTLIAQAAATLDELTDGRAEVAVSSGNFGLLAQYDIDWAKTKPLSRVKEAVHVIRTLLDDGAITYDGEFFKYSGLFTFARPVQERLPVKMGAMRGPKSFEVAAEFSDGCHHALSYTREAYDYMIEHCTIGAERAGKNVQDLDLGAWIVFSVAEDGAVAKDAARSMVGLYASSMPHEQLKRNGVDPEEVAPIIEAIGAGDMAKGIELTTPDLAERLSVAGTPEECVEKLQTEIAAAGINHMILAITDKALVKALMGREVEGVPDVNTQSTLRSAPARTSASRAVRWSANSRCTAATYVGAALRSAARPAGVRAANADRPSSGLGSRATSPARTSSSTTRLTRVRLTAATEPSWPMVRRRSGAALSSSSTSYHVSGRPWVSCSSRSKRGTSAACTLSSAPHVSARSSVMAAAYQILCVRTHFDITMCVRT